MMEMRPRTFLWIALAIVGIMMVGWVTKRPTLWQKLHKAKIHFERDLTVRNPDTQYCYLVPKVEMSKLIAILIADGFDETVGTMPGTSMLVHQFKKANSNYLTSNHQRIMIFDQVKCQVLFFDKPPL